MLHMKIQIIFVNSMDRTNLFVNEKSISNNEKTNHTYR